MHIVRLYLASIKSQLSYPLDFVIQLLVWSIYSVCPLIAANFMVQALPDASQETQIFVNLCYGLVMVAFNLARMVGRGFDDMGKLVLSGELDVYFSRPFSIFVQVLSSQLFLRRLANIAVGVITLITVICKYHLSLEAVAMLIVIIFAAFFLFMSLLVITAALALVTVKASNFASFICDTLTGIVHLLFEKPGGILELVIYYAVPIGLVVNTPLRTIISSGAQQIFSSCLLACLVSAGYLCLAIVIFNVCLTKYESACA